MRIGTASWEGNRQEKNVTFYEPHKSWFGTWRLLESYTTLTGNIVMSAISPQVFSLKVMFDAIFYEGKRRIFQYS